VPKYKYRPFPFQIAPKGKSFPSSGWTRFTLIFSTFRISSALLVEKSIVEARSASSWLYSVRHGHAPSLLLSLFLSLSVGRSVAYLILAGKIIAPVSSSLSRNQAEIAYRSCLSAAVVLAEGNAPALPSPPGLLPLDAPFPFGAQQPLFPFYRSNTNPNLPNRYTQTPFNYSLGDLSFVGP